MLSRWAAQFGEAWINEGARVVMRAAELLTSHSAKSAQTPDEIGDAAVRVADRE
jgi:hypothetical protein